MKVATLAWAAALFLQGGYDQERGVDAAPGRFRYERVLTVHTGTRVQACAVLDTAVYAHSSGSLDELRIYSAGLEVPFVRTESREAGQQEEPARVMNLGSKGDAVVFDLAMPRRPYTEVVLDLGSRDFHATARVSGGLIAGGPQTRLGEFELFDLQSQGLSRSTTLALQEVSFPVLHVQLTLKPAPGGSAATLGPWIVRGAKVPPSREAQIVYTTVAAATGFVTRGSETLASVRVPAHLPVERASFTLQPGFEKNFSREVKVTAQALGEAEAGASEALDGEIQRVRLAADAGGHEIRSEQMSVATVLAANLRSDAVVTVAVENGKQAPLPLAAVQLETRQRKLCFEAEPRQSYVLRYGDDQRVHAPVYDYGRLFRAGATTAVAAMGAEELNPLFHKAAPPDARKTYIARHPELLWVALLVMIAVLGTIALHQARHVARKK